MMKRLIVLFVASIILSLTPAHADTEGFEALNALIALEGPVAGSICEIPDDIVPERAQEGAFEGGQTGTFLDAGEEVNDENLRPITPFPLIVIDVPTGAMPSPLYGAQPFTQQMLRFEEFGLVPMGDEADVVELADMPAPLDAQSGPDPLALEIFLEQYTTTTESLPYPYPTREANIAEWNPWKTQIETFLGRVLSAPPAEGRPPGEDWAHQRYNEFFPKVFFYTAQAGARENLGLRDDYQLHTYSQGEFASSGLYHNTLGSAAEFDGTTSGITVQFHPDFPVQNTNALWTWDGTFPPKLVMARYGEPIMMRHYNALPIDPAANYGFGLHTLTTHEHNGHFPAESDGYTQAFFFPGQYYDYHWPMILAGHDSINTGATDPRAGAPDGAGGIVNVPGNWRETMSTHWFHDHMLDFTAQNVYKGNAAMINYYSSVDRGNEAINDGVNLRFPSGTALDWGNRDYDINLLIADKSWDADGQLFFNIFNTDGFIGDRMLVNWLWKPYFNVRARQYRFRILNSAVSRYMRFALVQEVNGTSGEMDGPPGSNLSYNRVPFHMIANDGNIMEHAVYFDGSSAGGEFTKARGILPTQAIAERYDIIVDFAQFSPGTKLYLVNVLEHENGKRPQRAIDLEDVLDGTYAPLLVEDRNSTDTGVTKILQFVVQAYSGTDLSMNPADYTTGKQKMIPLPQFTQEELDNAVHRTFTFGRSSGTDNDPWTIKTDGGAGFNMDPRRLSAAPESGQVEIWHIKNGGGGWSHPIHIHFEEGRILKRDGVLPPEWEKWSRKDVYRIGRMDDSGDSVDVAIRFREFMGTFMEHCHNTQHEDHAMLLRWDVESPGQVRVMPTPMPTWEGVGYVPSYALPTFRTGDLGLDPDNPDNDEIHGTPGNDVLFGSLGADRIFGGDGNDVIWGNSPANNGSTTSPDLGDRLFGEGGNDLIHGNQGDDEISGGDGIDIIYGGQGDDEIEGDDGDDHLYGNTGDDEIDGGLGMDRIYGGLGSDTLFGDKGNDIMHGNGSSSTLDGDDFMFGEEGDDEMYGNEGNDELFGGEGNDKIWGGKGHDGIAGEAGDDELHGNLGNDGIFGGTGNDTIYGEDGIDMLFGGEGNDLIFGNEGPDAIDGGAGNDIMYGGKAGDALEGNAGNDQVFGNIGDDMIFWAVGDGRDYVDGGADTDTFMVTGSVENETYYIETVFNYFFRKNGNTEPFDFASEIIVSRAVGAGADVIVAELNHIEDINIEGNGGNDVYIVSGEFSGTDLDPNTISLGGSAGDDMVDVSPRLSMHKVLFKSGGGHDVLLGMLHNNDVIELAPGTVLSEYTETNNGSSITLSNGMHSITYNNGSTPIIQEAP